MIKLWLIIMLFVGLASAQSTPKNLQVNSFGKDKKATWVTLVWEACQGNQTYILYRADARSGPWKKIQSVDGISLVQDNTVESISTYWYSIACTDLDSHQTGFLDTPLQVVIP